MNAISRAFSEILGAESVCELPQELAPEFPQIASMISPHTQAELAKTIAIASQNQWQILTCDSDLGSLNSGLNWGGMVKLANPGIVINTSRLNRLIDHAAGDLTVTCEAGIKFRDLQNILAKHNQFLAIDPANPETTTIGEIINTANTGSFRQKYGGVRDLLLGISFVRADGKLVKAGGRVVKNVAGYDLMKLMTGAYGTLGVISQATFRLYPLPQCDHTVLISGQTDSIDGVRAKILSSSLTPWAMDILSKPVLAKLSISLLMAESAKTDLGLILRFGGMTAGVEEQQRRLLAIAQEFGLEANLAEGEAIWTEIQGLIWRDDTVKKEEAETSVGAAEITSARSSEKSGKIVCKIGTQSNLAVANLIKISNQIQGSFLQIHARSGLGILSCDGTDAATLLQARDLLAQDGGFLTVLAARQLKNQIDVWGYTGNALEIMTALKQKFDPHNLLNPHRFIG